MPALSERALAPCDLGCFKDEGPEQTGSTSSAVTTGDPDATSTGPTGGPEAGLPGTYRAWLSDGVASPATRLAKGKLPYILSHGLHGLGIRVAVDSVGSAGLVNRSDAAWPARCGEVACTLALRLYCVEQQP